MKNNTVELYNRNNKYYWEVNTFVTEQGYQNVCEYCADILTRLNNQYNIWCIPTQQTWNGTRLGGLQDCKHIDMCIHDEVQKITIKDKALIIDVAHHDGNNQYVLYFTEHTEINDISEIPIMDIDKQNKYIENYAIDLYNMWYKGDI